MPPALPLFVGGESNPLAERDSDAIDYVLHKVRESGVKFVRLWFTDILGHLKGVAVTVEELENSLVRGMGFDGSSIEGFARHNEMGRYSLPEPIEENLYRMTESERRELDIETQPGSLFEAIQITENSELARRALGDQVFDSFIRNKKIEWDQYRSQVTDYEIDHYLPTA